MERASRRRLARMGIVTALALMVGVLVPSLSGAVPAAAATDGQMVFPASGNIQSKVGDGCRGNYRAHEGIDITGAGGAPILAAYDGVVKSRTTNSGYGNYTDIEHPGGYVTRYAHMASPGTYAPGTRVSRGQQIGVVGKTGATTAFHLHFEVRLNGAVYTRINSGFTCLSNVTRGAFIPLDFPGLGTPTVPAAPADYDGDGKADLLATAPDGDLQFFGGTGTGGFRPAEIITSAWGAHRHLTRTDLNRDGRADMLVARSDGQLELYGGGGTRGFDSMTQAANGWAGMLHVTSGADYSGDGKQDVLAVSASGVLNIYRGNGSGGLLTPPLAIGGGWADVRFIVGGDFDKDGSGDIMAVAADGNLYFHPGVANGLGGRRMVGTGWGGFTALTGGVDYDGDGRADLIACSTAGELLLYSGTGTGSVASGRRVATGFAGYLQVE